MAYMKWEFYCTSDEMQPLCVIWWSHRYSRGTSVHLVYHWKESQWISLMPKYEIYYNRQHLKNVK